MRLPVLAIPLCLFVAVAADAAVLEACVNKGNGMMRLVEATTACHANETRVDWNETGPAGPPGPAGPAGPAGPQGPAGQSAGGPPYVVVCTPVNRDNAITNLANLYVFNSSASTVANVAINYLNKNGVNLAGTTIPISSGVIPPGDPTPVWPGQTGATTVPIAAGNTLIQSWYTPQGLATDSNVAITIRVTSDQPIAVAHNIQFGGFNVMHCVPLPN